MSAAELTSGKGHRDENFPVASFILKREHRAPILAFYRFARAADDVADHPSAAPEEKLRLLDEMSAALEGRGSASPEAAGLRRALEGTKVPVTCGLELLKAFRQDVTKARYASWTELMDYCRWSAAPVGRFVLQVHGEDEATWPASDALCAALQVINHLQDCAEDYRELDRVYLPQDDLAAAGTDVGALAAGRASPALLGVIRKLAGRTDALLDQAEPLARQVRDRRLAYEIALIQRLARHLTGWLKRRDPLSERVHHRPWEVAGLAVLAFGDLMAPRRPPTAMRERPAP